MRRYFKYLKEYKWHCIFGPLLKWIEAALELMVPLVMKQIIDVGVANGDIPYVLKYGGVMLAMGALGLGCAVFCQRVASIASQGFGTNVRNALFSHINTLSYREIDKVGSASLVTRVVNDVNQMQSAVAIILRLVVRAPFIAAGAIVLCMITDWQIGLLVTLVSVLVGLVLFIIMKKSVPFYATNQRKLDRMSQITNENLEGARVVRAFSKRDKERARFDGAAEAMLQNSMRIGRISAYLNPLTFALVNLGIAAILFVSGVKVNIGRLTSGEIIAVISYMAQILNAMIVISNMVSLFTKAHASMNRVSEVFDLQSCIRDGGNAQPDFTAPAIQFENVSFSYAGTDKYALTDVSFSLEKGKTLGIIGGTGSGKTTLVNLFPRLYDCSLGSVKVFGHDVKDYSQESLRFIFGVVPQNGNLFSGTVRSNLFWGNDKASDEDFAEALKIACAYDFVMEKGGLDQPVAESGRNFSGGQKQRLTIARAVAGKPPVLVLDDSCSALDFATDAKVRANLAALEGTTTVIISQRASSIRGADEILVLEDGRIAGRGKHEELYENCGVYREICDSQARAEA
ncbi:ABC transporter ATP-binding protein [Candidatus Borkfalkia ceftriaxoniphila]|uniref:ABC transporter ATP-binding protein n=1 Tax=Candidatus Borkfalkia ceftriaxoniphila TaxID=2508949 RepID=A0A4Q2KE78_9FIRM|nr:ABC transporter ATP-binding protein [Candidatus Borkfalkia ceftriaxoniphila]RXZ62319.1 ABC transporter ATP-binding protein [Candidatus Borkfalkia ceftriaxoniphila]